MSRITFARLVELSIVLLLGALAFYLAKVENKTSFKVSELQRAIERNLSSVKTNDVKLESLSLKEDGGQLAVTLTLTGKHLGNEVRATAIVHGDPGYGAVRKHMLFTPKRVELQELKTIGKPTSVAVSTDRRDAPKGIDHELGSTISAAFATIKAHEMADDVSENAWLNYAKVQGDEVVVSWNKLKTTKITIFVVVAIAVLVAIMIWCPEVLFFWAIFGS